MHLTENGTREKREPAWQTVHSYITSFAEALIELAGELDFPHLEEEEYIDLYQDVLGGCWYPLELFPALVQNIVKILPTTWAMQGLLDLILRNGGLMQILPEAGVLLGFAAIFFSVCVMRCRYE